MNKQTILRGLCGLSMLLAGTAAGNGTWLSVSVPREAYEVTVGAEKRTVFPGCALGGDYRFHFKGGRRDKLLVYFAGGGACWDFNTCIGSLDENLDGVLDPGEEGDLVYVPSAARADDPTETEMAGLFDLDHPDNPYADWSMLFISYCTGDVHVGSRDTVYDGGLMIRHRGFDNFRYALDWLKTRHPRIVPKEMLVAGSSAGAYGAAFNYRWLREVYPDVKSVSLASDAGVGVLAGATEFADAVFQEPSVWNLHRTIHPDLAAVLQTEGASVIPGIYQRLRAAYPRDRFAQYTTAYDAVQIFFWDIMLNAAEPWLWGAGLDVLGWNAEMNEIIWDQQGMPPKNYRSYVAPGCAHTILDSDGLYDASLPAPGGAMISVAQWLAAMTREARGHRKNWQNLSCTPGVDCGEDSLTPEGISACLSQAYGL